MTLDVFTGVLTCQVPGQVSGLGPPDLRPELTCVFSETPDLRPDLTCVFSGTPDLRPDLTWGCPDTLRTPVDVFMLN